MSHSYAFTADCRAQAARVAVVEEPGFRHVPVSMVAVDPCHTPVRHPRACRSGVTGSTGVGGAGWAAGGASVPGFMTSF